MSVVNGWIGNRIGLLNHLVRTAIITSLPGNQILPAILAGEAVPHQMTAQNKKPGSGAINKAQHSKTPDLPV
jgi:hypothetical protein